MTPQQRVLAALEHREPDRTPIFEYVLLSPLADVFLGRPLVYDPKHWSKAVAELGWRQAVRQCAADLLDLAERLGHDMIYAPTNQPPPPIPAPLDDESADPVQRVAMRNARDAAQGTSHNPDRYRVHEDLLDLMRQRGIDLPLFAPAYVHGVWTDTDLMETMLLDPDVAHEYFQLRTQQALAVVEHYHGLGIKQIGVGGDFAGNRPLISPQAYRTFIMPQVRTVSRAVHAGGAFAINASDGDLWPVIDDFLIGCEVDGYMEIDAQAGMDLARLKAQYGDRITLYGNMDCGNVLSFAAPDEIRRRTIACLEAGWGDGGHIFTASNAITESVPLENYLAMVNAYRDYFGLDMLRA